MTESQAASGLLDDALRAMTGLRVWDPRVGVGSFVTINFGGSRRDSTGAVFGEFFLWVYGATWAIRRGRTVLATSDEPKVVMARAVAELDGECVSEVQLGSGLSLALEFGDQLTLETMPAPELDSEHWMLFLPDGFVMSTGPGETLTRERGGSSATHED